MMFCKPQVGETISVMTQYRTPVLDVGLDSHTYKKVPVLPSEKYDQPNTFRIPADVPYMDVRVIDLKNVIELTINGKAAEVTEYEGVKIVTITGSKGNEYTVTIDQDSAKCTCIGFSYRRQCRHLGEAAEKVKSAVDLKADSTYNIGIETTKLDKSNK